MWIVMRGCGLPAPQNGIRVDARRDAVRRMLAWVVRGGTIRPA